MHCLQEKNNTTAAEYHIIFGFAMQSKAMQCQARISKAMPAEAYQSFANKGKPYDDNDETLFGGRRREILDSRLLAAGLGKSRQV